MAEDTELARLREALSFYADEGRYRGPNVRREDDDPFTPADDYYRLDVTKDRGEIARNALAAGGDTIEAGAA